MKIEKIIEENGNYLVMVFGKVEENVNLYYINRDSIVNSKLDFKDGENTLAAVLLVDLNVISVTV